MNLTEAADHLNLSVKTLERAIKQGKLAATKHVGKSGGYVYEIEQAELDRFRAARSAPIHSPTIVSDEQTALALVRPDTTRPNETRLDISTGQAEFTAALVDALAVALDRRAAPLLTIKEAARAFNVSQSAIKAAIKVGRLKVHKIGTRGAAVIKRSDLDRWISEL